MGCLFIRVVGGNFALNIALDEAGALTFRIELYVIYAYTLKVLLTYFITHKIKNI